MNPEMIHDALTLLPNDLLLNVEKLRSAPRKARMAWRRMAALAACFALLIYGGFLLRSGFLSRNTAKSTAAAPQAEAPAESPAAAAPEAPAPVMDVEAEEAPADEVPAAASGTHSHSFAAETEKASDSGAFCGNTTITLYTEAGTHTLSGSDAITLTRILTGLDYREELVCSCAAAFSVDTETLTGIEVDLEKSFARCEKGQANLSQAQAETIQAVLDTLS